MKLHFSTLTLIRQSKKNILQVFFIFVLHLFNAQSVTFISEKSNLPLPKLSVFGKDGHLLAYSNLDGKIEKKNLEPAQANYQLVYNNYPVATLSYADFEKNIIKINDKVTEIETIVIKNNKPAKYIIVRGNFNTYLTTNNKLKNYADGIITYIFDNKTKKLKSANVEQYRMFKLGNPEVQRTFTVSIGFEIPDIKDVGRILEYKQKKNTVIQELKGEQRDQIEITGEALQQKEFALFGYRIFDYRSILNISYEKNSQKTLRDFLEYSEITFLKLKHKTEPEYNQLINYKNFYPTDISFSNEKDVEKVKFRTENSNYKTKFWEDPSFPNMQNVFSSFFKNDLKEQQNEFKD